MVPTHSIICTFIYVHTLSTVWGGLEASLTQTVEGALGVDTVSSQTRLCGCTFINILASGAPLSTSKAGCTETEEGPRAVEAFAMRSAVFFPNTFVHILTHGAIGQLEALGTEALVGTICVLALASQAAVLGTFTLIHIFTAVAQGLGRKPLSQSLQEKEPTVLVQTPVGQTPGKAHSSRSSQAVPSSFTQYPL